MSISSDSTTINRPLVAPASMLIELSKRLKAGELTIHPQKIVSVAEILEDSDRERIASLLHYPLLIKYIKQLKVS